MNSVKPAASITVEINFAHKVASGTAAASKISRDNARARTSIAQAYQAAEHCPAQLVIGQSASVLNFGGLRPFVETLTPTAPRPAKSAPSPRLSVGALAKRLRCPETVSARG